jgi:hypothetical protein
MAVGKPFARLAIPLACIAWLTGDAAPAVAEGILHRDPVAFVRTEAGLTASELGVLETGGIVAKVIDTEDRSEVLSVAAMRVKATPARVHEIFRDVEGRRSEPWVLQIGRLGSTPSTGDLETLTLDPGDVKHLATCRVNACEVRLPAEAIERFRKEIEWSSTTHEARANALFRQLLLAYAASYLAGGDAALFEYANNGDPVRIADSLQRLIVRSQFLEDVVPDLYAFLKRAPEGRPPDAEDFVYWQKERFWLRNVVSLNHVAIVDRATAWGRLIVAVSKQLYATQYYESSLGATLFVENPSGPGSLLIFINRTRADIRRTGFTWVERVLLKHLVRRRLEAQFKHLKLRLESS